uniref:hypothetical protein n=1 Tax=Acetomicrobium sp. S15 = DSM 107314 TaxID=2529858 RepID=UPI001E49A838
PESQFMPGVVYTCLRCVLTLPDISYIALKTYTRAYAAKLLELPLELKVNVGQGPSLEALFQKIAKVAQEVDN